MAFNIDPKMVSDLVTMMSQLGTEKMIPSSSSEDIKNKPDNDENNKKYSLLNLPDEILLSIYKHLLEHDVGAELVKNNGGRTPYRFAWPIAPADYRTDKQVAIDTLTTVSTKVRRDLMPHIMRGHILKLPAWTPDIKTQTLTFIAGVSEVFCHGVDWIWLEGAHWRISCHFVGMGCGARARTQWEDEKAKKEDLRVFECSETLEREHFVLRVDYQESARPQALDSAKETAGLVERLLVEADDRGRLGRAQMEAFVAKTALTASEQRVTKGHGVVALEEVPAKNALV